MKINLINQFRKSILAIVITIASFYGILHLQYSDKQAGITKHASLKPPRILVEKVEEILKQTMISAKKTTEIAEFNKAIDQGEQGDFVEENTDRGTFEVNFANNLVSVMSNNAILSDVLVQVSNKVGIPISTEAIDMNQRITLSIVGEPVDDVLRELLIGYDYFFSYDGRKEQLQATWVYPAGTGQSISLSTLDLSNDLDEDDYYSSDPVRRVLALQQGNFNHESAINRLIGALNDNDADVRATAILTAQQNAVALPIAIIKEMATLDSSALVRSVALNNLSMSSELSDATITEFAEGALNDPDESIREEAEAILEGLEQKKDAETLLQQQPRGEEYEKIS